MIIKISKLFFISLYILGCSTNPVTGKKALLLTSEKSENKMGADAYREILKKERKTTHTALAQQIEAIGVALAAVSGKSDFQWEFNTLESDEPNAFCLPGGKIAIYTGILPYAQNEAGLAAIMGHEIGHALARHGGQRMSTGQLAGMGLIATGLILGTASTSKEDQLKNQAIMAALGAGVTVGVILPFSRSNESEADEIGIILMAKAGYDPREAAQFWRRFSAKGGKKPPQFLSTHPSNESRIKHLESLVSKAMVYYEQAPVKRGTGKKLLSH